MRPRIIDNLEKATGSHFLALLVPSPLVMNVLAMLVVVWVFVKRTDRTGLSAYHTLGMSLWAIAGGLLGARLIVLLVNLKYTIAHPGILFDISGGTSSWGAYSGGFIAILIYAHRHQLALPIYLDILGSSMGLGPFIGRWSCFLNGCCYGKFSTLPWAVHYPMSSYPYQAHLKAGMIRQGAALSLSVHPFQLYLSLNALLVFFVTTLFWRNYRHKGMGVVFAFYWLLYGSSRFMIEFFRDALRYGLLQLTVYQYVCLLVVGMAVGALFIRFQGSDLKSKVTMPCN